MRKTEVYNWHIAFELKRTLEEAAKAENVSLAQLLEDIVMDWLSRRSQADVGEDEVQRQLHQAVAQTFGTIHGGDPNRSEKIRQRVRSKLKGRLAGQRTD